MNKRSLLHSHSIDYKNVQSRNYYAEGEDSLRFNHALGGFEWVTVRWPWAIKGKVLIEIINENTWINQDQLWPLCLEYDDIVQPGPDWEGDIRYPVGVVVDCTETHIDPDTEGYLKYQKARYKVRWVTGDGSRNYPESWHTYIPTKMKVEIIPLQVNS